jgi:hypothetical protein
MGPGGWCREDCGDQKRLRIEVGKLADELEQERRKSQGEKEDNSCGQSG